MKHDLAAALDDCLSSMRAGADLQACLMRYPDRVDELRPLLQAAKDVRAVHAPAPTDAARVAGRQRMLDALARKQALQRGDARVSWGLGQMVARFKARRIGGARPVWPLAAAAVVVILALASGTMAASADSLPGDVLYPVKQAARQVQVALTLDEDARERLIEQFKAEQRRDVRSAMRAGRHAAVELRGTVEQIDERGLIVSGLPARLQAETAIAGQLYVGGQVVLDGYLPGDGTLVATRLVVDGNPDPLPTTTPYPTAQPGETPEPTATPEPTRMLLPTRGPDATQTSEPPRAQEPAHQPQVTHPAHPTHPPKPTKEPKPTHPAAPAHPTGPSREPKSKSTR